ncbi:MAG: CvpA family protein [Clostridia bacterium]|nr:CvpA family protein [Clostridia bacterium]
MNLLDIAIVFILVMFAIVGFKRGIIRELASVIGIIIVFILSYTFKGFLGDFLCTTLPFFKFNGVIEGYTSINLLFYQIIAFIILFGLFLSIYEIVLKISNVLQKLVNLTLVFIIPSKILGAILSIIEGVVIIFVVLLFLMIPLKDNELFKGSSLASKIIYETPILSNSTREITDTMAEIVEIEEGIDEETLSIDEANLKTIDIMLRYKVVSKNTVEKLIDKKKFVVPNIETVLNKY